MYCKNCGQEIPDNSTTCMYCGRLTSGNSEQSKTWIGVLLGLFLGIIGLIIGLCIYPNNSLERSSFIKGWSITFVITIILSIIVYFACYTYILNIYSYFL